MTEDQMMQAVIDSIGNNTELFAGIVIGAMLAFGAMIVTGFFGGLFEAFVLWIRKLIKRKYGE